MLVKIATANYQSRDESESANSGLMQILEFFKFINLMLGFLQVVLIEYNFIFVVSEIRQTPR